MIRVFFRKLSRSQRTSKYCAVILSPMVRGNCFLTITLFVKLFASSRRALLMSRQKVSGPVHKVNLATEQDLESLAESIKQVALASGEFETYVNGVEIDFKSMLSERNQWIGEQKGSVQENTKSPLQDTLTLHQELVRKQVHEIKRLEAAVQQNNELLLKARGMAHEVAY